MAELAALKKSRGYVKTKLTNFEAYVKAFKPEEDDINVLRSRLKHFEPQLAAFEDLQNKIMDLDGSAEQIHEGLSFEQRFHAAIGSANTHLERRRPDTPMSVATVSNESGLIKLPTMNLPTFNGSYDQWLNFHDTFKAMIHDNPSLSDIQRFYYLRTSLTDSAAEVTHSLVSSSENYKVAWELLTKRFDNKKLMIENQLQAFCDIPIMQKDSGLRQVLDSAQKHSRSLKVLGADTWDAMAIHILVKKLDVWTKREWNAFAKDKPKPTFAEMLSFLEDRCIIIGAGTAGKPTPKPNATSNSRQAKGATSFTGVTTDSLSCPVCKNSHQVYKCPVFRNLSISSRVNEVKKHKLCMNCLRIHSGKCTFGRCRKCNQFHNSLLHEDKGPGVVHNHIPGPSATGTEQVNPAPVGTSDIVATSTSQPSGPTVALAQCNGTSQPEESQVLLSTALILVQDKDGNVHECRALLDSGSQSNLITRELSDRLSLPRERITTPINGVNNTRTNVRQRMNMTIRSKFNDYKSTAPFLVIEFIVGNYPATRLNTSGIRIPQHLTLADPTFDRPGKIDLLLGAGVFWDLLSVGRHKLADGQLALQKTQLGWVIAGQLTVPARSHPQSQQFCGLTMCEQQIHNKLGEFWELEECIEKPRFTQEEQACEDHFARSHGHVDDGRFILELPLRDDSKQLGYSKDIALKRLYAMERKFRKQPELKIQYTKFMDEYEELNHMTEVQDTQPEPQAVYYIPHHAVVKEDSETTKLRVVFDGSCKTSSNISLNDILSVGPTIQQDLFSIVLRFRHTHT